MAPIAEAALVFAGCGATAALAAAALRGKRRLDRRVAEFRREQEQAGGSGPAPDPYAALAELYAEDARKDELREAASRARRKARRG